MACALLGIHLFASADTRHMVTNIGWLFAAALLLIPFFDSERRNARLKDTAAEQALFRLAPPLPGTAAAFNRIVSLALLRGALLEWAMLAATVLLLTAMTGASASRLFMQACLCCLTLPLAAVGNTSGQDHVWLIEGGQLARRSVKLGRRDDFRLTLVRTRLVLAGVQYDAVTRTFLLMPQ